MEAALDQIQAEPLPESQPIRADTPGESQRIHRLVDYILKQPAEQRSVIRLASQEMAQLSAAARQSFNRVYRVKFIDKIKAILQSGMENGEFKRMDAEIATWALLGMMYPYFYPAHVAGSAIPDVTIEQILIIFLEGIQA